MLSNALTASFADSSEQRVSDRRLLRLDARVATTAGRGGVQVMGWRTCRPTTAPERSRTSTVGESPSDFQKRYAAAGNPRIPGCYVFMAGLVERRPRDGATQEKHGDGDPS